MPLRSVITALLCMGIMQAGAVDASNRFRSPRNPERRLRASTELIVLHTTEAPARSSLNKLSDRGEAHFCVTEEGRIFRIVDRDRMAFHAGRSMWNGKEDVDNFSIGIECVGYHDKPMGAVQLKAVRTLVKELQSMYRLGDDRVVCHSHVAYGMPNKWQKRKHRGRKRCGMLFAMPTVRRALGLTSRPKADADVRAGRLVVGDEFLRKVLYGGIDTMIGKIPSGASTDRKSFFEWLKPAPKPAAPKPAVKKTVAPKPAAPKPSRAAGTVRPKSVAELKARGFTLRGTVTKGMSAAKIAGRRWNRSDTYYAIRDKVIPGDEVDPKRIEVGMQVWMK